MERRFAPLTLSFALPLSLMLLAAAPAQRRPAPAPPPVPAVPLPDVVRVAITTDLGTITLHLDGKHAPVSTRNFLRYADQRRLDGTTFYRVMRLPWGTPPNGLIQGGIQGDPRRALPPIAHEPTSATGILHKAGTISMARWAPGTARADFSIMLSDMPGLDADPAGTTPDAQAGFAAFGQVVDGMDVVRRIYDVPLSTTRGEGVMKGQLIERPVRILTVRRVALPSASQTPGRQPAPAPAPSSQ